MLESESSQNLKKPRDERGGQKRMLGVMMGTLAKIKEESKNKDSKQAQQEQKRLAIMDRLKQEREKQAEIAKQEAEKRKQSYFEKEKLQREEEKATNSENSFYMSTFLSTSLRNAPNVYYLPAKHTPETAELIKKQLEARNISNLSKELNTPEVENTPELSQNDDESTKIIEDNEMLGEDAEEKDEDNDELMKVEYGQ
ncbi:hypothetical protein HK096_010284 [Nowakowskiella sp. JEL0078]|nr:hypothetical protein HK096_010284 [Nowakowskiella sp. JEL0078]